MLKQKNGFTVIEMLVVIVILGILASLTAFGFRGWQTGIDQRQIQSDLRLASAAMEAAKNFGSGYPSQIPGTFKTSDGVTMSLIWGDSTQYCLQGASKRSSSIIYNIRNGQNSSPQSGACSASPFPPATPAPTAIAGSSTTINVSWPNVTGATSYVIRYGTGSPTVLAGCTSSPCALTGLSPSTSYSISVAATNANGSSAAATTSASTLAPPVSPPAAPTIASVTVDGTNATVAWGGVSGAASYEVQKKLSSTGTWETAVSKSGTSHQYTGLSLGVNYNYQVRALNSGGASVWSATVTRVTVPTPYNVNVAIDQSNFGCGNDGGDTSWANGTMTWNGAANAYAARYDVAYGAGGFSILQVGNGYGGAGGGFSVAARSEGWFPQSASYPLFRVTGIGPNGERSTTAEWYGPYYEAGRC